MGKLADLLRPRGAWFGGRGNYTDGDHCLGTGLQLLLNQEQPGHRFDVFGSPWDEGPRCEEGKELLAIINDHFGHRVEGGFKSIPEFNDHHLTRKKDALLVAEKFDAEKGW